MLNIPENIKSEYYKDSVAKNLVISFDHNDWEVSGVNWYTGYVAYGVQVTELTPGKDVILYCNNDNWDTQLDAYVYKKYLDKADYVYVSGKLTVTAYTDLPTKMYLAAHYTNSHGGYGGYYYWFNPNSYLTELAGDGLRIYTRIPGSNIDDSFRFTQLALYCPDATSIDMTYGFGDLQVECSNRAYSSAALIVHSGSTPELPYLGESIIRQGYNPLDYITVGHDPIDNITNEDLVGNNFSLTESLCSQDNLKFGVCEASHISFSIADRNENFKDRVIRPQYKLKNVYNPSMGFDYDEFIKINWFKTSLENINPSATTTVTWTNANINQYGDIVTTKFYKVILSDYLDCFRDFQYAFLKFNFRITNFEQLSGDEIHYIFFKSFYKVSTGETYTISLPGYIASEVTDGSYYVCGAQINRTNIEDILGNLNVTFKDANQNIITSGSVNMSIDFRYFQIGFTNKSTFLYQDTPFNANYCYNYNGTLDAKLHEIVNGIPLGVFNVTNVKKSRIHQLSKCDITAYDNLVRLEQNAYDWYTMYMFVNLDSDQYSGNTNGPQFARQIFSSYWNIITTLGLDSRDNHGETLVTSKYHDEMSVDNNFTVTWTSTSAIYKRLTYAYIDIDVSSYTNKVFCVDVEHIYPEDDFPDGSLYSYPDPYFRGIHNVAEVLISENGSDIGFSVNNGDYFKLHDDCTTMRIRVPYEGRDPSSSSNKLGLLYRISVKNIDYLFDLANAPVRLLYYNYSTHELFTADSSITARDVVRSLLEVCGCFFKLDRYTGLPQFVYCQKSGLYPSETLYPADDLYPRQGVGEILSTGHYIDFQYEDYEVQRVGRIQIVKNTNSNESKSICEWEYVGDIEAQNTYKIDDNIFYCNEAMIYDYDGMPEVAEMLENMYNRISNLDYVPNTTDAIGLPFIECGDRLILLTETGGIESFIWQRNLKGIQALRDTYESEGNEYVEAVKDYGYKIYNE